MDLKGKQLWNHLEASTIHTEEAISFGLIKPGHGWNADLFTGNRPPTKWERLMYLPGSARYGEYCRPNAEKSQAIYTRFILQHTSSADDKCLDLFSGTGAALLAAVRTGRPMIGVEIDLTVHAAGYARLAGVVK